MIIRGVVPLLVTALVIGGWATLAAEKSPYRPKLAGILLNKRGRERVEALRRYAEQAPDDPFGHLELGLALVENQYLPRHEPQPTKPETKAGAPADPPAKTSPAKDTALEKDRRANIAEAGRHFETYAELTRDQPAEKEYAVYVLSVADLYGHDFRKAIARIDAYRGGLPEGNTLPAPLVRLYGIACREAGETEKALQSFGRLDSKTDPFKHHNIGLTYLKAGDLEPAITNFKIGLLQKNDAVYAQLLRGLEAERNPDRKLAALPHYRAVLEKGGTSQEHHFIVREVRARMAEIEKEDVSL